nr:immunoglobulin heavy chain junction region [Mus musculus]
LLLCKSSPLRRMGYG